MKSIQKIALVLTKILELLHWVGTASMAALAICSVAAGPWLSGLLERILPQYRPELNTYGYEMTVTNAAGAVEPRAVLLFGLRWSGSPGRRREEIPTPSICWASCTLPERKLPMTRNEQSTG